MNKVKVIKNSLVVVGIVSLMGAFGVQDPTISGVLMITSILIANLAHLIVVKEIEPEDAEVKESLKEPEQQPEPVEEKKETEEEIKAKELEAEKQELENRLAVLNQTPKEEKSEETVKPTTKELTCPICDKVCKSKLGYTRHIAMKHPDKIKLDIEVTE